MHVADFGAFVELEEGVEGLIHTSELEGDIEGEAYAPGKEMNAVIIHVDGHGRKISLSEKSAGGAEADETSPEEYVVRQGTSQASLGDLMGNIGNMFSEDGES